MPRMAEARVIEHERGKMTVVGLAPTVAHIVVEGVLDRTLADEMIAETARVSRQGGGIVLHDWSKLDTSTSTARQRLTDWTLEHRRDLSAVHILVRSSIVAMGVNVANLALGGFLKAGTDTDAFASIVKAHGSSHASTPDA
jgi:hypothetical protein